MDSARSEFQISEPKKGDCLSLKQGEEDWLVVIYNEDGQELLWLLFTVD